MKTYPGLKIAIAVFLMVFASVPMAEGLTLSERFQCSDDKNGAPVELSAIQAAYSKLRTMNSQFTQESYLAAMDDREVSSGTLVFKAPGKMLWDYKHPEPQRFIVNGKTVWFYQELDKQVLVDSLDSIVLSDLPLTFLMGIGTLDDQFKLKSACSVDAGTVVVLEPRSSESAGQLDRLYMVINTKTHLPMGARVVDLGGNITTIWFDDVVYDKPVDEQTFSSQWPASVDIIDRRK